MTRLLADGENAWVTLVGPGGVGKTRLALEIATAVAAAVPVRAFVDVADAAGGRVEHSIAAAFGLEPVPDDGLAVPLLRVLDGRAALLVVDDVDRVAEAGVELDRLIAAVPDLTVLATSHSPTGTRRERCLPVRPLPLVQAVELFVERARTAVPGFELDEEARPIVEEICVRLDGLPLALELAANRLNVLSARALLARLEHPLDVLGAAPDPAAGAQGRTLRETLDFSYSLLSDEEQALLSGSPSSAGVARSKPPRPSSPRRSTGSARCSICSVCWSRRAWLRGSTDPTASRASCCSGRSATMRSSGWRRRARPTTSAVVTPPSSSASPSAPSRS